jgi:type II secretory pathway component PulF
MSRFWYKARDQKGSAVTGVMEAESAEAVALRLNQAGVFPVTITPERSRPSLELRGWRQRVRAEELIFFSRQLAILLRAGVSLLDALGTLARQTRNRTLRTTLETIQQEVEGGSTLSAALAKHPRVFSEIYIQTIRAAEAGGFLVEALTRLAGMLEFEAETRRRISAAIRYPSLVLLTLGAGVTILVTTVIPRFADLYASFKANLPWPTRMAFAIGTTIRGAWPLLLVGMVIASVAFRWFLTTPVGRRMWDDLKLRMPVLGPLFLKLTLSRLVHILGTLTGSGIPLVPALEISSRAVGNTVVAEEVRKVRKSVEGGSSLAEPLAQSPIFTPLVVQMVAVGEKTGALDQLLPLIGEHYDTEAGHTIRNLATTLEPVLLVVMAVLVFFLALAVLLPLWDMVNLIRR